jgi:hypothetical protein
MKYIFLTDEAELEFKKGFDNAEQDNHNYPKILFKCELCNHIINHCGVDNKEQIDACIESGLPDFCWIYTNKKIGDHFANLIKNNDKKWAILNCQSKDFTTRIVALYIIKGELIL